MVYAEYDRRISAYRNTQVVTSLPECFHRDSLETSAHLRDADHRIFARFPDAFQKDTAPGSVHDPPSLTTSAPPPGKRKATPPPSGQHQLPVGREATSTTPAQYQPPAKRIAQKPRSPAPVGSDSGHRQKKLSFEEYSKLCESGQWKADMETKLWGPAPETQVFSPPLSWAGNPKKPPHNVAWIRNKGYDVLYRLSENGKLNTLEVPPEKLGLNRDEDLNACYGVYFDNAGGCPYKEYPDICMRNHNVTQAQISELVTMGRISIPTAQFMIRNFQEFRPVDSCEELWVDPHWPTVPRAQLQPPQPQGPR